MISSRSQAGVSPVTTAHSLPVYSVIFSATWRQCSTLVQKMMTDLRSFVRMAISEQVALTSSSLSIAEASSSWTNSPARMWTAERSASARPARDTMGER